jgi:glycerol uptake facilitator-like aquaporin
MKINKLIAEFLGTGVLAATVVGSGIMATSLTKDVAVQLLIVAVATVFILAVLIQMLAPISGAHFNPAVSLVDFLNKGISAKKLALYIVVQVFGGVLGVITANAMFELPGIQLSTHERSGTGLWLGEVVATAGLILVIQLVGAQKNGKYIPFAVAGWIGAAYFFTSSTSFANPAVTFARSLSDTFAGIELSSVPAFILAQLIGAGVGLAIAKGLKGGK